MSTPAIDLESRIFDAVNEAKDMFWEHIASEFTEAKFGDMPWEDISEFDAAAERAVRAWVANNVPPKPTERREISTDL